MVRCLEFESTLSNRADIYKNWDTHDDTHDYNWDTGYEWNMYKKTKFGERLDFEVRTLPNGFQYPIYMDEITPMGKKGKLKYYFEGKLHRKDGPAIISKRGKLEYWENGIKHRANGPAVRKRDGTIEYWINGVLHCDNGPAVMRKDNVCEYWLNGTHVRTVFMKHEMI